MMVMIGEVGGVVKRDDRVVVAFFHTITSGISRAFRLHKLHESMQALWL
jgi:hypothetical protein